MFVMPGEAGTSDMECFAMYLSIGFGQGFHSGHTESIQIGIQSTWQCMYLFSKTVCGRLMRVWGVGSTKLSGKSSVVSTSAALQIDVVSWLQSFNRQSHSALQIRQSSSTYLPRRLVLGELCSFARGAPVPAFQLSRRAFASSAVRSADQAGLEGSCAVGPPPSKKRLNLNRSGAGVMQNGTGRKQKKPQQQAAAELHEQPAKKQKKGRIIGPEAEVRNAIIQAAKEQDPSIALQAYDRAMAEGIRIRPEFYNTLLFLCSGGDNWQKCFQDLPIPWQHNRLEPSQAELPIDSNRAAPKAEISPTELLQRGRDILEHTRASGADSFNEMSYTALARIAAAGGDGDGAFQAAKEGQKAKVPARLRTFLPSLLAYAASGDVQAAFEVDEAMRTAGLDLTETEYAALLYACKHGASAEQAQAVLQRIGKELTTLSQETLKAAEAYFRYKLDYLDNLVLRFFQHQAVHKPMGIKLSSHSLPSSEAAAATLKEGQHWLLERCSVDADGVTSSCGGRVQAVDLEESEWTAFADGIAKLAAERERKADEFKAFQLWLERHGPFSAVIDGANIAFFGQNYESGKFQFCQIGDIVETIIHDQPDRKPLVVLHARRLRDSCAEETAAKELITTLQAEQMLYASPYGSNDDWYWIYAAVKAGSEGVLVSNDEMRDHIFQLLAPKYFLKWKQRHQMRYRFTGGEEARVVELFRPPKFTACTQHLSTGSWLLPASDSEEWLCARPIKS